MNLLSELPLANVQLTLPLSAFSETNSSPKVTPKILLPILTISVGKPMLLRDLAIFREIADAHARFFSASTGVQLAQDLEDWIRQLRDGSAVSSRTMKTLTWRESTQALLRALGLNPN